MDRLKQSVSCPHKCDWISQRVPVLPVLRFGAVTLLPFCIRARTGAEPRFFEMTSADSGAGVTGELCAYTLRRGIALPGAGCLNAAATDETELVEGRASEVKGGVSMVTPL